MNEKKIESVSEMSHFKKHDTVWYLRYKSDYSEKLNHYIDLNGDIEYYDWDYETVKDLHPKDNFKIYGKKFWPKGVLLPRLPSKDFVLLLKILLTNQYVYTFKVHKIRRSTKTGEFYYRGKRTPWMPETCLFDTERAAILESRRIVRLFKRWLD